MVTSYKLFREGEGEREKKKKKNGDLLDMVALLVTRNLDEVDSAPLRSIDNLIQEDTAPTLKY